MLRAVLVLVCCASRPTSAQDQFQKIARLPHAEKLSYRVEWHLINAGSVTVDTTHTSADDWQTNLHIESAGVVARLYRVLDSYRITTDDKFCTASSVLDAQEGKRHTITHLTFQRAQRKVDYDEHDLLKNASVKKELDVAPCTDEIAGALETLRQSALQSGKWVTLPITDGKKMAFVKIEGQTKETLNLDGRAYQTIRYEAFVFDNVLYKRKGRLLIWMTDDADRLPVQLRLQLGFPVGNVTVLLEKAQKG